jgi:hypothetical protein
VAGGSPGARAAPAPTLVSFPYASTVGRYLPPNHVEGGEVVVPVTLLDGRRFEIAAPPRLAISGLAVAIEATITLGPGVPDRPAVIASHATVAQVFGRARPRRSYAGVDGSRVLLFDGLRGGAAVTYLVFRFGGWLLTVEDDGGTSASGPPPLTDGQRILLASSLAGSVDADGYLVLHARAPVALGAPGGLGSAAAVFGAVTTVDDPQLDIEDGFCGRFGSDTASRRFFPAQGGAGVAWCDRGTGLHVDATGTDRFVNDVAASLSVAP